MDFGPKKMRQHPLYPFKCTVWCAVMTCKVIRTYFYDEIFFKAQLLKNTFDFNKTEPLIMPQGKLEILFRQDGATGHIAGGNNRVCFDKTEPLVISPGETTEFVSTRRSHWSYRRGKQQSLFRQDGATRHIAGGNNRVCFDKTELLVISPGKTTEIVSTRRSYETYRRGKQQSLFRQDGATSHIAGGNNGVCFDKTKPLVISPGETTEFVSTRRSH